jgi:hypothetical protein
MNWIKLYLGRCRRMVSFCEHSRQPSDDIKDKKFLDNHSGVVRFPEPVAKLLPNINRINTNRFEPTIPVFERAKIFRALDRAATVIGLSLYHKHLNHPEMYRWLHGVSGEIFQYREKGRFWFVAL